MRKLYVILCVLILGWQQCWSQDISQFDVFAGRFDYLAIGNTLNITENGNDSPCELLSESSATLTLQTDQTVIAAYLYWAGSGTGDFEVTLNDEPIIAERTFADAIDENRPFFAAFTNITDIITNSGNIDYTFSGLDIDAVLPTYCPSGTNFAGWSIIVIYEDMDLPLNQVNVFDGLESVSQFNNELTIQLENLNVLDNDNAKIGFLAWEGDANLAVDETLSINGNLLSNPPLNPVNNQFNGTNSFANTDDLNNMDIDVYNIENNIDIGDTEAIISLTSGQDFVMINVIITVLNSQLPDAIISLDTVQTMCNSRNISITYTVTNQGTEVLPSGTPISFYGNGILTGSDVTSSPIPLNSSQEITSLITIDPAIPEVFTLLAIVDDPAIVVESNEENNESNELTVNLTSITIGELEPLVQCDDISNDGFGLFDLTTSVQETLANLDGVSFSFYINQDDALNQTNPILTPDFFENTTAQQTVYVRFVLDADPSCFRIEPLDIVVSFQPIIPVLEPLQQCDDTLDNDGIAVFDLTTQNTNVINSQSNTLVSYYLSLDDADMDINSVDNPSSFINTTNPQSIYVRLENESNSDCFDIGFFDILINPVGTVMEVSPLVACNEGFEIGIFDLTIAGSDSLSINTDLVTGYYLNLDDAQAQINSITDPFAFENIINPQTIYMRIEGDDILDCYEIAQFQLQVENCPPFVPEGFSPNGDGINDTFEISRLKDVFDYELLIYSRLGNHIYQGDANIPFWDGTPNKGLGGSQLPTGVYYWVLYLNDPVFKDMAGWVYLNR